MPALAQDLNDTEIMNTAQRIGQVEGLNIPVPCARSGPGEVILYIPYKLTILPRP